MNFFFEKNVFSHPLQLPVHFLACYCTNSVIFLLKNIHFSQSMHVIAQDVSSFPVKDESLGLETKGTETLGLVQNFGTCLVSVKSRMKIFGTVSSRSRLVGIIFT